MSEQVMAVQKVLLLIAMHLTSDMNFNARSNFFSGGNSSESPTFNKFSAHFMSPSVTLFLRMLGHPYFA